MELVGNNLELMVELGVPEEVAVEPLALEIQQVVELVEALLETQVELVIMDLVMEEVVMVETTLAVEVEVQMISHLLQVR